MDVLLVTESKTEISLSLANYGVGYAPLEQVEELRWHEAVRVMVLWVGQRGVELCRSLRQEGVRIPLLLILPELKEESWVAGLEAGADSVLDSQTSVTVLQAQLKAILRRSEQVRNRIQVGELILDITHHRAERRGVIIPLSGTEYRLLLLFMENAGKIVSRDEIMKQVWPEGAAESDNVLDVYVSYLRSKIDRPFNTSLIQTVRGQGYRICPPSY